MDVGASYVNFNYFAHLTLKNVLFSPSNIYGDQVYDFSKNSFFTQLKKDLHKEKSEDLFGIFHCFTGTLEQAHQAISYNMKLGIGGVATFKNGKIDQFLNQIDLKHIVLETDAPYLSPVPFRGKRNESSYILNVIEKLSNIYGVSNDYIAEMTTQNSKSVFKL